MDSCIANLFSTKTRLVAVQRLDITEKFDQKLNLFKQL